MGKSVESGRYHRHYFQPYRHPDDYAKIISGIEAKGFRVKREPLIPAYGTATRQARQSAPMILYEMVSDKDVKLVLFAAGMAVLNCCPISTMKQSGGIQSCFPVTAMVPLFSNAIYMKNRPGHLLRSAAQAIRGYRRLRL